MEYRSTNAAGWTHHQGDLVAGVASSHGVQIGGGSTGGVVEAVGDDTNISLAVRGKGTGLLTVGNSSNPVTVAGSSVAITSTHVNLNSSRIALGAGASTTALSGFMRVRVDFTVPEIAANAAVLDSTFTAVGLTTNALMMFHSDALAAVLPNTVDVSVRCSTAGEGRLVFRNIAASTIGTGLSTSHGYLAWFNF